MSQNRKIKRDLKKYKCANLEIIKKKTTTIRV